MHRLSPAARLSAACLLALSGLAAQERSQAPAPPPAIRELVRELTSSGFEARERATDALIAMGDAAHPELKALREELDLEGRMRVDAILAHHESREADVDLTPRLLKIEFRDAPTGDVLAELSRIAGVSVRFPDNRRGSGPERLSFSADGEPFLRVLDLLCEAQDWSYNRDHRTGDMLLYPRGAAGVGPVAYAGPIRVEATAFSTTLHTNFRDPPTARANLQIRIDADPGCPIVGLLGPIHGATGVDQEGRPLSFSDNPRQNRFLQSFGNQSRAHLSMTLDPPPDERTEVLRNVAVPVEAIVPARVLDGLLLDGMPTDPGAPGAGALALRMESRLDHGTHLEVRISHRTVAADGPDLLRIQPSYERIEFRDGRGAVLSATQTAASLNDQGRTVRTFQLDKTASIGSVRAEVMSRYRIVTWTATLPDLPIR